MAAFLIGSIGIFLVLLTVEIFLSKRYHIKKTKGLLYKTVNKKHFFTETILILMFIFFFLSTRYLDYSEFLVPPLFVFLGTLFLVRAGFEFVYERESKRFLQSMNGVIGMLLISIIAILTM